MCDVPTSPHQNRFQFEYVPTPTSFPLWICTHVTNTDMTKIKINTNTPHNHNIRLDIKNFAYPNLIYHDAFVFCSIPRLFVCLRMRMSSKEYANVYVKSISMCPRSIAGVPFDSVRRFRASLLLCSTCCISAVIGLLAVWRHNKPKTKKRNGKGTGNLPWKKICQRQPANFFLRIASESEKVFARIFYVFRSPKNKCFLDGHFKLLWPWPLPLYFDIENHFILSQKSVLDGDSQH